MLQYESMTSQEIGAYIRELRNSKGVSQEELGKFLDKTHAAVSDIERGKTQVSLNDLTLISNFFGVQLEEIISGAQKSKNFSSFSQHRAERGMNKDDIEKMKKAREDFRKKARLLAE